MKCVENRGVVGMFERYLKRRVRIGDDEEQDRNWEDSGYEMVFPSNERSKKDK